MKRRDDPRARSALPTEAEINVFDSLDEQWAVKIFLGKTLEEAEAMFRENALYRLEDLMWMGPKAFCYYVKAAIRYLESDAAAGDAGAASGFLFALESHLAAGDDLAPAAPALREAVQSLLDHWEKYFDDFTFDLYGDWPERAEAVLRALSSR